VLTDQINYIILCVRSRYFVLVFFIKHRDENTWTVLGLEVLTILNLFHLIYSPV